MGNAVERQKSLRRASLCPWKQGKAVWAAFLSGKKGKGVASCQQRGRLLPIAVVEKPAGGSKDEMVQVVLMPGPGLVENPVPLGCLVQCSMRLFVGLFQF